MKEYISYEIQIINPEERCRTRKSYYQSTQLVTPHLHKGSPTALKCTAPRDGVTVVADERLLGAVSYCTPQQQLSLPGSFIITAFLNMVVFKDHQ